MLTQPRYVLVVPDLARSVACYRDVLGFAGIRTLDGHRMMLGQPAA